MSVCCDLVLVAWNKLEYTQQCLESILARTQLPYRLIIVDNGSDRETATFLQDVQRRHPERAVLLRNEQNVGWCKAANQGLRHCEAPYVCTLNNDLIVMPGWLDELVAVAESDPAIGLVVATYNRPGESLEAFRRRAQEARNGGMPYVELNECNGACLLIRRRVLSHIGLLDEAYGSDGKDDADLSRRAQVAGFRCVRATRAHAYHWGGVTLDTIPEYWTVARKQAEARFQERWGERKQLAVLLSAVPGEPSEQVLRQSLSLARVGVRIHLLGLGPGEYRWHDPATRWRSGFIEHNNLKWALRARPRWALTRLCWLATCTLWIVGKSIGRRRKGAGHHLQAFVAPSAAGQRWLRALAPLHRTPVRWRFEECEVIARELEWVRGVDRGLWSDVR